MSPLTIGLALVIALLVAIPTRRLAISGARRETLAVYFVGVWALGLFVAIAHGPVRVLLPILLVAYLAPFVTLGPGLDRLRDRFGLRRVPGSDESTPAGVKDVTPRDGDPPAA